MASDFTNERTIKYLNKDFQGFKRDLMKFSQAHHSGVFQDFNETSPGMAILELQAYVGDVLSFYQDQQFDELKHDSAVQIENVVANAKSLGYRPSGKRASRGVETFFVEVPATTQGTTRVPDDLYSPIMRKGAKMQGPNGVMFESLDDIVFSASAPTPDTDNVRMVTGSRFDDTTGMPTHFALRKDVQIIAGETKSEAFSVGDFQRFRSIELSSEDVIEVLSVLDSDGNEWTEVDYLAQETVFASDSNSNSDSDVVPYVLKLQSVPRRFITDRDPLTNKTSLIFGSGDGVSFDDELLPNLADLALPLPGRKTFSSFAIDPQNFLKTRSLGMSPFNTTLTVTYRVGGGSQTNVQAGSIKNVSAATLDFVTTGLDPVKRSAVLGSIECVNLKNTEGGGEADTIPEIKANAGAFFAAQDRVVTKEDYIARIMSIPARFGKPEKVSVKRSAINASSLDVHILAKDVDGHLTQATPTLVGNIATYVKRYRMLTDGVNILQTSIINVKVDFGVVASPKVGRSEVLANCLAVVRDYLDIDHFQIGQPIILSDILSELQSVDGVISVYKLNVKNIFGMRPDGLSYSTFRYDTQAATANNILYCPDDGIFEVKFPTKDIVGEAK
jgi:hypothetical protein